MDPQNLWDDLRQGSRNVAGVTWQVDVCVYMLIAGHAGELPFVCITPEGYEDADCEHANGAQTFVQMKEVSAGQGRLAAAAVAMALAHAEASGRGSEITLVTDGTLGSGLSFTGWFDVLSSQQTQGVENVVNALIDLKYGGGEAKSIVSRAHVVQLPYRVRELSEQLLAQSTGRPATVCGLSVGKLTELIADASAAQRHSKPQAARRLRTTDVDQVVSSVQDAVDTRGLDRAQQAGVCEPADFLAPDAVPARTFYLGMDGQPGHVAANLDVIRPIELVACAEGLRDEHSVLILGPSGSGKSVLLWRAARDLVPSSRVLRVRRVATENDAVSLGRHVRLMRPSEHSPVLVVADDLGRPATAAWPDAAKRLRETQHTYLLGAARAEDFHPSLLVGATRVVQPHLDLATAREIGSRAQDMGITLRMDVQEALAESEGLLMEFLAVLTTGQRLRQVLSTQVADLARPDRRLQRDAARLLTAAHALGLSLDSNRLAAALAPTGDEAPVGDALAILRDEHIIVEDLGTWRGLHELRSATITELLHESPPPTLGATWARVAALLKPGEAGWILRRAAERDAASVPELIPAIGRLITAPERTAVEVARVLEGAERADNAIYAQASIPVLRSNLRPGVQLSDLAMLVYPTRNQEFTLEPSSSEAWRTMINRVKDVAAQMPLRVNFDNTLAETCAALTDGVVARLLSDSDIVDIVRLLEAGREYLRVPLPAIRTLTQRVERPHDVRTALVYSRLVSALARHIPPSEIESVLGSPNQRALAVAQADPWTLAVEVDAAGGKIQVQRLLPFDGALPPVMDWDSPRTDRSEALNVDVVACIERLKDACPEISQFELRTLTASGTPYRVADHEPGHKNMHRKRFPNRSSVRQAVGFQAALRRATESQTWTEVIREQIEVAKELVDLSAQVPLRLKPHDNSGRRTAWLQRVEQANHRLADISPPPMGRTAGPAVAAGRHDQVDRRRDATSHALSIAADALEALCPGDQAQSPPRPLAVAMSLRSAAKTLEDALGEGRTVLGHLGSPIPDELIKNLERSANLAAAIATAPKVSGRIRASEPLDSSDEIWADVASQTTSAASVLLHQLLHDFSSPEIERVLDPDPPTWSLDQKAWLITASMDDLDPLAERLDTLSDDDRSELAGRLVVLAVGHRGPIGPDQDQGMAEAPLNFAEPHRVSLDVGLQLSYSSSRSPIPLTPEQAAMWATASGLARNSDDPLPPIAALEDLIVRSTNAALVRMRRLPPAPAHPVSPSTSEEGRPQPTRTANGLTNSAAAEALRTLESQVAAEEAGTATTALAAVVIPASTDDVLTSDESVLLSAVLALHFARLSQQNGFGQDPYS
ncbi:P-loop NTPase [Janibacter sp. Soil728]|uniref:P-loop NTPase n=1 Tax=Janibacter sp. Soil728 TaxID=1736393 RepID=UPI0012E95D4C|nr:hypothetical protein [Janibacter sp. Soil728]